MTTRLPKNPAPSSHPQVDYARSIALTCEEDAFVAAAMGLMEAVKASNMAPAQVENLLQIPNTAPPRRVAFMACLMVEQCGARPLELARASTRLPVVAGVVEALLRGEAQGRHEVDAQGNGFAHRLLHAPGVSAGRMVGLLPDHWLTQTNAEGDTPLLGMWRKIVEDRQFAHGAAELTWMLLDRGVDPTQRNQAGVSALDCMRDSLAFAGDDPVVDKDYFEELMKRVQALGDQTELERSTPTPNHPSSARPRF